MPEAAMFVMYFLAWVFFVVLALVSKGGGNGGAPA